MIEVRRVRPDDSFSVHQIPGGVPLGVATRWVVRIQGDFVGKTKLFFGFTKGRALRKALRYLEAIDRAEKSRQVIER